MPVKRGTEAAGFLRRRGTLGATGYAVPGAGVTAVAFGLARYAFGLFVPSIPAERHGYAEAFGAFAVPAGLAGL